MIYLLFDELLPQIYKDVDQHETANYAIIIGAILMFAFECGWWVRKAAPYDGSYQRTFENGSKDDIILSSK